MNKDSLFNSFFIEKKYKTTYIEFRFGIALSLWEERKRKMGFGAGIEVFLKY